METHVLETRYRGAVLRLEFDTDPHAKLLINGLVREQRQISSAKPVTLKLGSSVQTDYEWHEFIEGIVRYDTNRITAKIMANNAEVASENFDR